MVAKIFFEPSRESKMGRVAAFKQTVDKMLAELGKLRFELGFTLDDYPVKLQEARQLLKELYYELEQTEKENTRND